MSRSDYHGSSFVGNWAGSQYPPPFVYGPPLPGLVLWLKADAGVTQGGGTVSVWADQSGNGNDVSQATAAKQPVFTSNSINGIPGLTFDGSNSCMYGGPNLQGATTTFMVFKAATNPGTGFSILNIKGSTGPVFSETMINLAGYQPYSFVNDLSASSSFIGIGTAVTTSPTILGKTYNGSGNAPGNYTASVNGASASVVLSGAVGRTSTDKGSIGARINSAGAPSFVFNGDISEIIVYDHVLSSIDNNAALSYLELRYGL